ADEEINNGRAAQSTHQGNTQAHHKPDARKPRKQEADPSKPREKCGERHEIERRDLARVSRDPRPCFGETARGGMRRASAVSCRGMADTVWNMREMQVPAHAAGDERKETEKKASDKTDQVKICPGHRVHPPFSGSESRDCVAAP